MITTFEVMPGVCQDVVDLLQAAYAEVISRIRDFIGAALHVNDAQTRIANYSQWRGREDFQALLRSDEMRRRNRQISGLCKSFEPVMYDVTATFGEAGDRKGPAAGAVPAAYPCVGRRLPVGLAAAGLADLVPVGEILGVGRNRLAVGFAIRAGAAAGRRNRLVARSAGREHQRGRGEERRRSSS